MIVVKRDDCIYFKGICTLQLSTSKACARTCDYFKKVFWKKHRFEYGSKHEKSS